VLKQDIKVLHDKSTFYTKKQQSAVDANQTNRKRGFKEHITEQFWKDFFGNK
jgi:hypothetical protein